MIAKPASDADIDDFIIETKLNYVVPFGEFVLNSNDEYNFYYNLNHNSDELLHQNNDNEETLEWEKQLWQIDKTKYFHEENQNKVKFDDKVENDNSNKNKNTNEFLNSDYQCEKHVVYHKFNDINSNVNKNNKIVFNWTIKYSDLEKLGLDKNSAYGEYKDNIINFR